MPKVLRIINRFNIGGPTYNAAYLTKYLPEEYETLLIGGDKEERPTQGGTGIGVNAFLWRATLDTVSFMPLASADPFGGVILTDWHSTATSPNERYKLNFYILDYYVLIMYYYHVFLIII